MKTVAVGFAVATAVASCTGADPDEGSESSRSSEPEKTASGVERFALAAEPVWRGDTGGLPEIMTSGWHSARYVDDVLLLEYSDASTAVVDPETGEPYWTADSELMAGNGAKNGDVELSSTTGYAPLSRVRGEWAMFVTYRTGYHTEGAERGRWTAAVRVKDASLLWKVPALVEPYDIVDSDERIVLLAIGSLDDRPVARAISTADGSTVWETKDVWGRFLAGEHVLGTVSSQPPELAADDSYVVGLDAETGQRRWSLEGRYHRSEVGFVVGDVALVYVRPVAASDQEEVVLVDVASGAEIAKLGWDFGGKNSCAGDDSRLIACTLDDKPDSPEGDRLVTFDVAQRAKHVSPPEQDVGRFSVKKVEGDYVFVDDDTSGGDDWWAVDRDGVVVSDKLPGVLIGISEQYAAFTLPDGNIPAVYQREQ
ncbi:PQQ-binding-like beta-propeller repeat protein [Actinophytocola sp.]|uniref:outer membrane protein assembly factor BamB family protein n=1 Tax=Actinophytocola sp. TaxID=1872138 RepID=UPI0025C1D21B|nr:PQQ-binding-like beta-propeller repeat protein [Actinophytocola sp.]